MQGRRRHPVLPGRPVHTWQFVGQVSGSLVEAHGNTHTDTHTQVWQGSAGVTSTLGRCHKQLRQVLAPSMVL